MSDQDPTCCRLHSAVCGPSLCNQCILLITWLACKEKVHIYYYVVILNVLC